MDNLENKDELKPVLDSNSSELEKQVQSLQHLVVSLLILLLVVSGTFSIYLQRQLRSTSKQLDALRPYASNIVSAYQKGDGPVLATFVSNMIEFAKLHPEFAPIATKYNLKQAPTALAGSATAVPPGPSMPGSKK